MDKRSWIDELDDPFGLLEDDDECMECGALTDASVLEENGGECEDCHLEALAQDLALRNRKYDEAGL